MQAQIFGTAANHIRSNSAAPTSSSESVSTAKRKVPESNTTPTPTEKKAKHMKPAINSEKPVSLPRVVKPGTPTQPSKSKKVYNRTPEQSEETSLDADQLHPSWAAARNRAAILQKPTGKRVIIE